MAELYYGNIDQIGDANKSEEKGRYRVRLNADDIVTGWIYPLKKNTKDNVDDYSYDEQEAVAVLMNENMREGVILGALNTKANPPKETDVDIQQFQFKDESYFRYDRKNHKFDVYIKGSNNKVNITADGGEITVNCKNATISASDTCKIDAKLTVTKDAVFQGKISAVDEIKSDVEVKAGPLGIALTTHKHPYTDTPVGAATTQVPIP